MQWLKSSTKFMMTVLLLGSVVVVGGTLRDYHFNSNEFMLDNEIKVSRRLDDQPFKRIVASAERELPAAQYLPLNDSNKLRVDGKWEIIKIHNTTKEVLFDITRVEDKQMKIIVELQMIGTSLVRIDGDKGLEFDISLLHESGKTIALFRSIDGTYEVIEARRFVEKKTVLAQSDKSAEKKLMEESGFEDNRAQLAPQQMISQKQGVQIDQDFELVLERALDPNASKEVLRGSDALTGSASLSGGNIENLKVVLFRGTDKEKSLEIGFAQVNDGGQFNFEDGGEVVSGILTNNGREGFRIRIATGSFAGAMLNFVTEAEFEKIRELEEKAAFDKLAQQEEYVEPIEELATEVSQEDESVGREKYDAYEQEQLEKQEAEAEEKEVIETEEEMAHKAQTSGFNFMSGKPQSPARSIASEK
ncbi:MAG: hypothetical protein EP319_04540 [Deltaproteobacteria bacterium]|nr:MAG: hypothetical protein EP319_04540 [Deltaproteobacteria bacterium]